MGEAKRRGSYTQRKTEAIIRQHEDQMFKRVQAQQRIDSMTQAEKDRLSSFVEDAQNQVGMRLRIVE